MTHKGRILVVDDDRLVLATVTHGLAQAGYEVIDADNGDEAILLARERQPELALLDIRMEGLTGFDVAEYLRDVAHVPFMFLSAFADDDTRARVDSLGAQAYLVKPLDVGQIVPTVEGVLARLRGAAAAVGAVARSPAGAPVGAPQTAAEDRPAHTPRGAEPAPDLVSLALGILMHRHSLSRAQATERLHRMAQDKGIAPAAQAARLVEAVEELAGSAGGA